MDEINNAEMFRHAARAMVNEARRTLSDFTEGLPTIAETPGQRELAARHGTPLELAEACIELVGEISTAEARAAVSRYLEEWRAA